MSAVPYVSIIIPTYNRATMLPITLDSFIALDYPNDRLEIIVANNNSIDETKQVLEGYCSRYSHFKTILEPRQGVHYARNSAARMARGEILYFTDDDMIADPIARDIWDMKYRLKQPDGEAIDATVEERRTAPGDMA